MNKFVSRKLVALVAGGVIVGVLTYMKADPKLIQDLSGLVVTYLAGQSVADAAAAFKNTNLSSQGQ